MAKLPPYLKLSKTGFYSYRRRIPARLQEFFPRTSKGSVRTEWKESFKTKSRAVAERAWTNENRKFEKYEKIAERLASGSACMQQDDRLVAAKNLVIDSGLHPDQAPKISNLPTHEEIESYSSAMEQWRKETEFERSLLDDAVYEEQIDYRQMQKDYDAGVFFDPYYRTPLKPQRQSVISMAAQIASGELTSYTVPTWADG